MLKAINRIILLAILSVAYCTYVPAQNEISSPYSKYGYGLPSNVTSGAYDAMGKVGYAVQHPHLINFKNPASYVAFDSLSFIADAAFSIYSSTLKTADVTQQSTYARPAYITIGLPLTRHWRTSAGILPFSNLGYYIADSKALPNNVTATYNYKGSGGLLQLYWGNAFKICKGLSLGVNVSYLFGRLNYTKSAEFDGSYFFHTMVDNTTQVDGLYLSGGIQKNKHDGCRSHAEGYYIRERVHVNAHWRLHLEQSRGKTVKKVEGRGKKYQQRCHLQHPAGGEQNRQTARDQIAAGDDVRDVLFHRLKFAAKIHLFSQ